MGYRGVMVCEYLAGIHVQPCVNQYMQSMYMSTWTSNAFLTIKVQYVHKFILHSLMHILNHVAEYRFALTTLQFALTVCSLMYVNEGSKNKGFGN